LGTDLRQICPPTLRKAAPADRGGEFVALERECEATLDLKWFRGGFIRGVAGLAASVLQQLPSDQSQIVGPWASEIGAG